MGWASESFTRWLYVAVEGTWDVGELQCSVSVSWISRNACADNTSQPTKPLTKSQMHRAALRWTNHRPVYSYSKSAGHK